MKTIIVTFIMLLPVVAIAAKDCRIVEYADHIDAICQGDPNYKASNQTGAKTNGAAVSKIRSRIEEIRALNAARFDTVEERPKTAVTKIK